jgi:tetratricopeptide (TPR) repeat protein
MNRIAAAALAAGMSCVLAIGTPAIAQVNSPHGMAAPFAHPGKAEAKDPAVEKLVANAEKLDKQVKAKPKDAALKKKAGDAWYKAGYAQEYSKAGLSPRTRYRVALKYYRTALALDPTHKKATAELKQIEDIYRGMPGGIPK